jgi:hypothetical protein
MSEVTTQPKKSAVATAIDTQKNLIANHEAEIKEFVLRISAIKITSAEAREEANKEINKAAKLVKVLDDGEKGVAQLFKDEIAKRKAAHEEFTKQLVDAVTIKKAEIVDFIQAETRRQKDEADKITREKEAKLEASRLVMDCKRQVGDITNKVIAYIEKELNKCTTENEVNRTAKTWFTMKPKDDVITNNYEFWIKGNELAKAEYNFTQFASAYKFSYASGIEKVNELAKAAIAKLNGDKLAIERAKIEAEERAKVDAERKQKLEAQAADAVMKAEIEAQAQVQASKVELKGVRRVTKVVVANTLSAIPMQSWATLLANYLTTGKLEKLEFLITAFPTDGEIPEGLKLETVESNIAK